MQDWFNSLKLVSTIDLNMMLKEVNIIINEWRSCSCVRLFVIPGTVACSSVHGDLQARILDWVAVLFYRGCSQPRDWTQVSCITGGFLTIWATREAPEYSLSFLQGNFPTQEFNRRLLHCRRILYQLSYQGSPTIIKWSLKNAIKYLIKARIYSFKKSYSIWGHSMSALDFLNPRRCVLGGGE